MSDDETEADIVLQLDALATYAERADHWKDDMRLMDAAGVADTIYGALDRIEELEAKLAKVVEERDEALNQLDSARHSIDVLERRIAKLKKDT